MLADGESPITINSALAASAVPITTSISSSIAMRNWPRWCDPRPSRASHPIPMTPEWKEQARQMRRTASLRYIFDGSMGFKAPSTPQMQLYARYA
jgi:hypothetical protein